MTRNASAPDATRTIRREGIVARFDPLTSTGMIAMKGGGTQYVLLRQPGFRDGDLVTFDLKGHGSVAEAVNVDHVRKIGGRSDRHEGRLAIDRRTLTR